MADVRPEFLGFLPRPLACLGVLLLMAVALGSVWATMRTYERLVQRPLCFEYAARKQLPDLADLVYTEVQITGPRSHSHACRFRNARTGEPVVLQFDRDDVPTGTDTGEVMAGVLVFLLFGLLSIPLTPRPPRRSTPGR